MKGFSNTRSNIFKLARYNIRIVFGGRFVYFVLAAYLFFFTIGTIMAFDNDYIMMYEIYDLLILPAILLVFYPSAYGIQHDADQRTLEILFGIPDYRYKVWLLRLFMVQIIVFFALLPLALISHYVLISIPVLKMVLQLMVLVVFSSTLGFCVSTLVKNGNASAVIMVVIGLVFLILVDEIDTSKWNVFLNPFNTYHGLNEVIWQENLRQNRIMLGIASVVFLLLGLLNLQNREKFLR